MLPILFMVVLNIVLGNLAYVVTHDSGLYSIVPLIALGAAITGSALSQSDHDARALLRTRPTVECCPCTEHRA